MVSVDNSQTGNEGYESPHVFNGGYGSANGDMNIHKAQTDTEDITKNSIINSPKFAENPAVSGSD